jgi:hypothetical protein
MRFFYLTLILIGLSSCRKTDENSVLPSSDSAALWGNIASIDIFHYKINADTWITSDDIATKKGEKFYFNDEIIMTVYLSVSQIIETPIL